MEFLKQGPFLSHQEYLTFAYLYARKSHDPSTQVGALIADPEGRILSYGANNFPFGTQWLSERWEKPGKYMWVEHAERNAIFQAAKMGEKTNGATMYCTWFSCADCARAIIQAGITRIIGHNVQMYADRLAWASSMDIANIMLDEAGIERIYIEDHLGMEIRFNGQKVVV